MHKSAWVGQRRPLEITPRRAPLTVGADDSSSIDAANVGSGQDSLSSRQALDWGRTHRSNAVRLICAPVVGHGEHRSGWPYALRSLLPLVSQEGVLLDDFVERTFAYGKPMAAHAGPWVGIFHHPPDMPPFSLKRHRPQELFQSDTWLQSLPSLRLAIALSDYLAEYLREALPAPVVVVRHPTGDPSICFSPGEFQRNPCKRLIQIGWYLRNTRGIYQLPLLPGFVKTRLVFSAPWIRSYDARVAEYWLSNSIRREYGDVEAIPRVSDEQYDLLLSRNVAFAEYFDASASNLVVECLARNTPIITNRHPALVEYLGPEYPLFFDRLDDVPGLLSEATVLRAYEYLSARDKSFLRGDVFCQSIASEVSRFSAPRTGHHLLPAETQ